MMGSALDPNSIDVREADNNIVFTIHAPDCNETIQNAILYYSFESEASAGGWNKTKMHCDGSDLKAIVPKKSGFTEVYFYAYIEYSNGTFQQSSYVHSYKNQDGQKTTQILCIVAFFIFFIAFEVVMRYPTMKMKKAEKEEKEENEEKDKGKEEKEDTGITKCPNCGKIIPADSETCPYCGTPLKKEGESKEITMGGD
jgi:rubrerythrin